MLNTVDIVSLLALQLDQQCHRQSVSVRGLTTCWSKSCHPSSLCDIPQSSVSKPVGQGRKSKHIPAPPPLHLGQKSIGLTADPQSYKTVLLRHLQLQLGVAWDRFYYLHCEGVSYDYQKNLSFKQDCGWIPEGAV